MRREQLFDRGLTEPLTNFTRWDPSKNIIRWAWVNFDVYRSRYGARAVDGTWPISASIASAPPPKSPSSSRASRRPTGSVPG